MASQSRRSMVAAPSAGLLGVTAEGEAHRREYLIGKLRLPARFEARVERCGEHRGRHAGLDRRLERPAPFAGIRHAPPEAVSFSSRASASAVRSRSREEMMLPWRQTSVMAARSSRY